MKRSDQSKGKDQLPPSNAHSSADDLYVHPSTDYLPIPRQADAWKPHAGEQSCCGGVLRVCEEGGGNTASQRLEGLQCEGQRRGSAPWQAWRWAGGGL